MTDRTCSVEGCDRPHFGRGWCRTHYARWQRNGDPVLIGPIRPTSLPGSTPEEKLLLNRTIDPESGCWRWTGSHLPAGYGQIVVDGKKQVVHRVAHDLWIGPIPDGYQVDHVLARGCIHKDCFNPAHLEAVTQAENLTRSGSRGTRFPNQVRRHRATHCKRGHDLALAYVNKDGRRDCRMCGALRRQARAKKEEA